MTSGLLSAKFSPWLKLLLTQLFCCLHKHLSQQLMLFFFFAVLNLYRLIISFIAFIHIVRCLKLYLREATQMDLIAFLRMFQNKCDRDCNRDYFQCNRNQIHYHFVYS